MSMLSGLFWFGVAAYGYDVLIRPDQIAEEAKQEARRRQKPILNIGAGTNESSLRAFLFGPTLWGDVNLDIAAKPGIPSPQKVVYGNIYNIPFPDKYFGSVVASHVVEHLENPKEAIDELYRVADSVYVITPLWWCPHTWLHPDHKWLITKDGKGQYIKIE